MGGCTHLTARFICLVVVAPNVFLVRGGGGNVVRLLPTGSCLYMFLVNKQIIEILFNLEMQL